MTKQDRDIGRWARAITWPPRSWLSRPTLAGMAWTGCAGAREAANGEVYATR